MKNKFPIVLCCSVLFMSSALAQEAGLIAHGAEVVEVQGGFGFLEGPVSTRDGTLYFTDIDNNVVHRMLPGGQIDIAYSPSHYANGLTLDLDGSLLICE